MDDKTHTNTNTQALSNLLDVILLVDKGDLAAEEQYSYSNNNGQQRVILRKSRSRRKRNTYVVLLLYNTSTCCILRLLYLVQNTPIFSSRSSLPLPTTITRRVNKLVAERELMDDASRVDENCNNIMPANDLGSVPWTIQHDIIQDARLSSWNIRRCSTYE